MSKKIKPKGGDSQTQKRSIVNQKNVNRVLIGIGLISLFFVLAINITAFLIRSYGKAKITTFEKAPTSTIIMILGASVKDSEQPGELLKDRLDTGIDLYKAGKAPYILITGDDGLNRSNEIYVMLKYLIDNGIPKDQIIVDHHGYRTYESCKRAHEEYLIENAIIVTQNFHLPRALFLCNNMGIMSHGVSADRGKYEDMSYNYARDWLASVKAFIDTYILEPKPPVSYQE